MYELFYEPRPGPTAQHRSQWRYRCEKVSLHLINVMLCSPTGTVFYDAVECTGEVKSGEFIAALLIAAIKKLGQNTIVQVCYRDLRCIDINERVLAIAH